jgi:hypothetical protein
MTDFGEKKEYKTTSLRQINTICGRQNGPKNKVKFNSNHLMSEIVDCSLEITTGATCSLDRDVEASRSFARKINVNITYHLGHESMFHFVGLASR